MIAMKNKIYIIILAGGAGRRLWPVSRRNMPKQFLDIFGTGETMLQTACARAAKVVGNDHIIVVTNEKYRAVAKEQLPWLSDDHLLCEPVNRNTAPSASWAVHRVMMDVTQKSNHDEALNTIVAIMPSDQLILHENRFQDAIERGADFVSNNDAVLTIGATPTRTEPGYGYIQTDRLCNNGEGAEGEKGSANRVFTVKSFVEKPDREFAKMLIESGEFLWNTGIYMARVGYFREQIMQLLPTVLRNERSDSDSENEYIRQNYSRYPNMSLDLAILEKMPKRAVMHCDFGWADIGAWHGIYEAMPKGADENVIVNSNSTVITEHSNRNVIAIPSDTVAILSGLDGYIVSQKDNVLLICPKGDSSSLVRRYLSRIENDETLGEEFV